MNTAKQMHKTFGSIFPDFSDDFREYKISMELYNGEKKIAQLRGCHVIHTAAGESVLKTTAIAYAVYSTKTRINLDQDHYIKGSNLRSKHTFIEIVNNTKVQMRS